MRGIQYAAPSGSDHWRLWNTGSSAFADDDSWDSIFKQHCSQPQFRDLAAHPREFFPNLRPSQFRGRRESRMPDAPAASCAAKKAHE
jgi:hypothetical protein